MATKEDPRPHVIIYDTNAIHSHGLSVIARNAKQFIDHVRSRHSVEMAIPEMVAWERSHQIYCKVTQALSTAKNELNYVRHLINDAPAINIADMTIRQAIETTVRNEFANIGVSIIATPFARIDWSKLTAAAVWREPPFEQDHMDQPREKGFRDAVIKETIVDYANLNRGYFHVITGDEALAKAIRTGLKPDIEVVIHGSRESYSAFLSLFLTRTYLKTA